MNGLRLLSALACCYMFGIAGAEALEITDKVHDYYQLYLRTIGADGHGAFAVSIDGTVGYQNLCSSPTCDQAQYEADAIAYCASVVHMTCSLLAADRLKKVPVTVIPALLEPTKEMRANIIGEDELRRRLIGNTMRGKYLNSLKWAEYFDPSGEILGKDDIQGDYEARWTIADGKLCFDYTNFDDWCAEVSLEGDHLTLLMDGKVINTNRSITVHPGNGVGH